MTRTNLTPEEFADQFEITFEDTEHVAGVEVAEYTDEDGETLYTLVYMDGTVENETFSDVWKDGGHTLAEPRHGIKTVMIDDDGVHTNWD